VKVAKAVRDLLDERGLAAFAKTSGKTGIHVLAPWTNKGDYDAARAWALELAGEVVDRLPEIATLERRIKDRGGRLYLDVVQNARGHHVVPPYVARAVPGATISTPLEWRELNARLNPRRFDLKSAVKRFKSKGDLMARLAAG
jgi:bifunctional non-homologous end joining protein LigD